MLVISAQLPFQMLSSKSPSSTDNMSNKKRKVTSPLVGSKSSKVVRLATKENSVRVHAKEGEDTSEKKLNSSNDSVEIILDDEKKDLEESDQQKTVKDDSTPKRRSLGKNKLDRSQQKPGALTKFLKRIDREVEESDIHDDNLSEVKDKKDCQNASVYNEKNEICLNESSDAPFIQSELQNTSQLSETNDPVTSNDADPPLQESDCDITIVSSDNEASSELNKSISNRSNESETDKPASPVTPKTDKDTKNKIKKLTPKQLEKRQEIARRKEEKLKLKMVCI